MQIIDNITLDAMVQETHFKSSLQNYKDTHKIHINGRKMVHSKSRAVNPLTVNLHNMRQTYITC